MARSTQQLSVQQGFQPVLFTLHLHFLKKQISATLCSTWDLKFPDQGLNLSPLHGQRRILTIGLLGKSLPLHL